MEQAKTIGVIMDGNRRFAKERGLATLEGHKAGYEKLKEVLKWAREAELEYVIAYAFSTENWRREEGEVSYLMDLFRYALLHETASLKKEGVRLRFIGDLSKFPKDIEEAAKKAEEETKDIAGPTLVLAISYGGRAEILNAVKALIASGEKEMSEELFSKYLWTKDIPDPDLIIRTSGEIRTSNFLPWQSAYSELFFTKTYWPDFSKEEFMAILQEFSKRQRRRGK